MVDWIPKARTLQDDIEEEEAKYWGERLRNTQQVIAETPEWFTPSGVEAIKPEVPETQTPSWLLRGIPQLRTETEPVSEPLFSLQPPISTVAAKQPIPMKKDEEKPEELQVPFWQRALQVFTAPFEWVEENLIKPGAGLLGTELGFVSEVPRQAGEDFWEWKKRSWASWESPGVDVKVPWSDEPLRLDVRGIMEIAPWLLIPGAGQVGGGLRAGRGIAGLLGKAGKAGRIVGTAVEYSPWGVAEKTAGVAIRAGFKATAKAGEKVSQKVGERLFGKYEPPPTPESVQKLTAYVKKSVMPARRAFQKELPQLRARQEKGVRLAQSRYNRGEITLEELISEEDVARAVGIKSKYTLSPSFTQAEIKEMRDMIVRSAESGLVKTESGRAFDRFILNGELPEPHNLRGDWSRVFGEDFAKAVGGLRTVPHSKTEQIIDALNIGRSLQASIDLSATGRQGLILSLLHPTQAPKWFGKQIKALISEKWSLQIDDAMRADPMFNEVLSATRAYIAPIREATLSGAEELFASRIARRIPGIRRSERAFVTYLNQARWAALKDGYMAMKAQGATLEQMNLLGRFVDIASGRGIIPKSLEKFSPFLNMALFSPRLQAATLQLPRQLGRMLLSDNPYMRKEAAKALITFVGGGSSILGLMKARGGKVELDPRSGDFGKIVIGDTRLDIWRGYLQYSRFFAQMLTEERKSAYGNMNKAERSEIAFRFLQSKSSPAFGLMVDLLRGETYMGKPIFDDTTGFIKAASERVIPLALQDIIDAMEQSGTNGLWVAAPATFGVGALTYVNDYVRVKQKIARQLGYKSWDDIDPKTQRQIQNNNAELQAASIDFDRQVMGTAWGDWRLAGNAIEELFRENIELAVAQYRDVGDGVQFREKVAEAFTARRGGYAAREKEERFSDIVKRLNIRDTTEALVSLGPEQLAIKAYNDALFGDDMYDEFGDYRFDEARARKELLRQQLEPKMFKYVEDYMNIKYETFPEEFKELQQAKEAMRPYWEVANMVEDILGKRFAESPAGQRFITKQRQMVLLRNPEINYYRNLFYVR